MDVAQLTPVLEKKIAILPGGRDRHGGAIIIFPSHGDFVEFSFADVAATLNYLTQIPEESVRSRGYTIMIDMRHAWIRYLKTIMKAIQHVLFGKVRQVIIVKPEQFLEKQRINIDLKLEVYECKISVVSLQKLNRHFDLNQLPSMFNGSLSYEHRKWLDLRTRYETFLRDGSVALKDLENHRFGDGGSKHASDESLEFADVNLAKATQESVANGQQLLDELREEEHQPGGVNQDYLVWAHRVEALLHQIRGSEDNVRVKVFEKDKADREQTEKVVYEQFLIGVSNVTDWLLGPGEKWLLTLHEIGESTDETEQLKRDHEQLETKAKEIERQTNELRSIADELLILNHPQLSEISRKREYLDSISKAFLTRVDRQKTIVDMSNTFHRLMDEFGAKLDDMLENLCSEVSASDVVTTQASIDSLDDRISAIEKAYQEVTNEGEQLLHQISLTETNLLGYEVTRDYLPGVMHVRHMLSDLHDRQQRSHELADVRRLKLQQMLQLFTCEDDAAQAIKWLHDLCNTLLTQCSKTGTTSDEALSLRRDHQKLEQTGRSTYEYGRQLMQISSVLRRSLRFDMTLNYDLNQRLEEAWSRFCRALSERASRLNITQAFYHTAKQVSDRLDDLVKQVNDEAMRASVSTQLNRRRYGRYDKDYFGDRLDILSRYGRYRRELTGDVSELKHIAEALVARMEHPVDSKESPEMNLAAIDDIRQRFLQVEEKLRMLDSCLMSMTAAGAAEQRSENEKQLRVAVERKESMRQNSVGSELPNVDALVAEMSLLSPTYSNPQMSSNSLSTGSTVVAAKLSPR